MQPELPSPEHLQLLTNDELMRETSASVLRMRTCCGDDRSTSQERAWYRLLLTEWNHRGLQRPQQQAA
jgi:hypothetical protein